MIQAARRVKLVGSPAAAQTPADTLVGELPDAGGLARQVKASRFVDRPRVLRES